MFTSSLGKKYLMALTGLVLIGFVFVHMAGNLQILLGQQYINAYAHALQSLPLPILWASRLFLLICVIVHAWTAYALIVENRRARPDANKIERTKRAGLSSLRMGVTGSILLSFIIFHLLHFTIRVVYPQYGELMTLVGSSDENPIHDVYSMVIAGFQHTVISVFYVVAMFLLCSHLAHGVSSVFQSLGLRSESWRPTLDIFAKAYAWVIFSGFSVVPLAVLGQKFEIISIFEPNLFSAALALHQ
ncbi:MAG: succinate dehydrogenase cytochrome b subunit [Verrucomicrobiota bacterium]|jgi:succinate dehydrogenase / fumarate reductase cytochrome b subunit|nr:succinate:quinone oxidoreductase [Opitutae bacterium]MBO25583.1 succinate:quinone oxidoreductase [Opitutales bacterium]MEC7393948.1 succinate dehydrogenase cytochrome b subunit [Verrucomicrobiota bacterium]MEC7401484.1 succinate dehydrogenase cytochrome b subunit [Verrucomicrobiota bacterium]MEC7542173.1 succinate dehydrogenase cytochrome b subunit [Verrucomicrobiota bacterium]|tara:strand:- start:455 stop:1189 length:735 start_codon:yes stop_codon:yes gene_type:complete